MLSWSDVVAMGSSLPGVTESTSYGTPALKVSGKLLARYRTDADGSVMVDCELDEKDALVAADDPSFYTERHYDGYGAILVNLDTVDPAQLYELLADAWRRKATAKLKKQAGPDD